MVRDLINYFIIENTFFTISIGINKIENNIKEQVKVTEKFKLLEGEIAIPKSENNCLLL